MAWTLVATSGIISKTLPPPRESSGIDVLMRKGKDKNGKRYRDSGTDATMRDAVSDADGCLVTELLKGTGGIRHLWNCESYLREVLIHPSVSTTFGWTLHSSSI